MTDTTRATIRDFIVESFLFGDATVPLADDSSLLETGIMDSTSVLELVAYIEETFGIVVADADIIPANLDSIAAIARYAGARSTAQVA